MKNQPTECKPDACNDRQVIQEDGTCKKCSDYTKANTNTKKCEAVICSGSREFVTKRGECNACDEYKVKSLDGKKCEKPKCDSSKVI